MEPYIYKDAMKDLITPENVEILLKIKDRANFLRKNAGAFTFKKCCQGIEGDSNLKRAAIDFLECEGTIILVYNHGTLDEKVYK